MCKRCDVLRLAWYFSPPERAEDAKAEYMAQLRSCPKHQAVMAWAATCPPNPDLTIEQLQAAEVEATR